MHEQASARSMVSCIRDEVMWGFGLKVYQPADFVEYMVIETPEGQSVGLLELGHDYVTVRGYEVVPGQSWIAVTPSVIRYLKGSVAARSLRDCSVQKDHFLLELSDNHPLRQIIPSNKLVHKTPDAWYIRVAHVVGFLQHISTVLERRLAESVAVGHSGEMKINFFSDGLKLIWKDGKLKSVEKWQPSPDDGGNAPFADLSFLQLLFGYRNLEELKYANPDCGANDEAHVLLSILFPKKPSQIGGIE